MIVTFSEELVAFLLLLLCQLRVDVGLALFFAKDRLHLRQQRLRLSRTELGQRLFVEQLGVCIVLPMNPAVNKTIIIDPT